MTHAQPTNLLDLRQVKCPLNFVKAKLALEKIPAGHTLTLLLSHDLTINVPNSLRQEGYQVVELKLDTDAFIQVDVTRLL